MIATNDEMATPTAPTAVARPPLKAKRGLFAKYAATFGLLVAVALVVGGAVEAWFAYREQRAVLVALQVEQAAGAAALIERFVGEIERQVGWTTHFAAGGGGSALEQRRIDFLRLLRQAPAVTDVAWIDGEGRERLKVSRIAMDVTGGGADRGEEAAFVEARKSRVWRGPVWFHKESEPYMTIAVGGAGRSAGVTVADVNLKFVWDVVSRIKVGRHGQAYVADQGGRLVAHPDISLVLRQTDLSALPQVRDAIDGRMVAGAVVPDPSGREVSTASARIPSLGWTVFADLPIADARAPLFDSLRRTGVIVAVGIVLAAAAGLLLARRLTVPIRALQAGVARITAGDLGQQIEVRTGDEIEELAGGFNRMAWELRQSYADLEHKVDERTAELQEALERLRALGEVGRAVGASLDLPTVLSAILAHACELSDSGGGAIYAYDAFTGRFELLATHGMTPELAAAIRAISVRIADTVVGRCVAERDAAQIADLDAEPGYPLYGAMRQAGVRALLAVPLTVEQRVIGALVVRRKRAGAFDHATVELLESFATQSALAIENARLVAELQARSTALASSVEELQALHEIGRVISASLDLDAVLQTIITNACRLAEADGGGVHVFDETQNWFVMAASVGINVAQPFNEHRPGQPSETLIGRVALRREPVQIEDVAAEEGFAPREAVLAAGKRSLLGVPLLRQDELIGCIVVNRFRSGAFTDETIDTLRTFAGQAALAIHNAKLYRELEDKNRQIEEASRHKSQFLANMSHELRTPLNAILGFAELIQDGIYGTPPARISAVLERVQANGRHLLALINDVLDLARIEAGQLTLRIDDYVLGDVVQAVRSTADSLAIEKGLRLRVDVPDDLPRGRGDQQRIAQVLLNLVGNAIKFTDAGEVGIAVMAAKGRFEIAVTDTGPGIAPEDQARIFEEFHQVDSSATRRKGGTGLGLAIATRIVALHGGRLWVESEPGKGACFRCTLPVRVEERAAS